MIATAYTADRVFDGDRILKNQVVLVEDKVVTDTIALGDLPADMPLQQYLGCTLIPGLIDTHMHFMRWQGPLFLAYGVTSVRDTGNDLAWVLQCRDEWPRQPWPFERRSTWSRTRPE